MARRRRHSQFSLSSLANLRWWLKADAIVDAENNAALSSWIDSGPLGNDFAQSASGNQPLFQRNALNGLPSVKFDGADDFMESRFGDTLDDFTVVVVFRRYGGGAVTYERVIDKNYVDGFWIGRDQATTDQWGGGVREPGFPYGGFGTFTDGAANLMIFRRSGTTLEIYNGRTLVRTTAAGAGTTDNALYRLAVAYYGGYYSYSPVEIFEPATYSAALSAEAMASVCEYVKEKWRVG